jgi:hypothetical protein
MAMKKSDRLLSALLLSMIVMMPGIAIPWMTPPMMHMQPYIVSTNTRKSTTSVVAFNQSYTAEQCILLEEWTNGTKIKVSLNFTHPYRVYMSGTAWKLPTISSTTSETKASRVSAPMSTGNESHLYPYTYNDNLSDFMPFLRKGNNGTCIVSYNHDNNYDCRGQHPGEWYWPGKLVPSNRTQKDHIHLATQNITDWINGVHDTTTILGMVIAFAGGAATFSFGVLAALFGIEVAGVPMILSGLATMWGIILAWLGYTKERWIRDVVTEAFHGDGWTWVKMIDRIDYILVTFPFWWCTVYEHWRYTHWTQSWGSEGVLASTQEYEVNCLGFITQPKYPPGPPRYWR